MRSEASGALHEASERQVGGGGSLCGGGGGSQQSWFQVENGPGT